VHDVTTTPRRRRALAAAALATLTLTACGSGSEDGSTAAGGSAEFDLSDWASVEQAAAGSTVNWYMFGGSDPINAYVNGWVKDALAEKDITLNQVRVTDTAEVVNRVLGEKQAGRDEGSVDMIWINGENFKSGKQADLWYCDWATELPNAEFVDFEDPAVTTDFGEPVEGCEASWSRAQSLVVYDSAKVSADDVRSLDAMESWAQANPGRFTYAAPPDFTGSMVVRTFLYDEAGGPDDLLGEFDQAAYDELAPRLWERLNALEPSLYRGGATYPQGGPEVEQLYANGEVDAYLAYSAGDLVTQVEEGVLPATTRTAVFEEGTIGNISFVTIPENAPNKAAALVLANLLQSPEGQYQKQVVTGAYPGIDVATAPAEVQAQFDAIEVAEADLAFEDQVRNSRPELVAEWVTNLDEDWVREVLQK
jgi:putative spermidine/putrescine transport system substrate-binding protein